MCFSEVTVSVRGPQFHRRLRSIEAASEWSEVRPRTRGIYSLALGPIVLGITPGDNNSLFFSVSMPSDPCHSLEKLMGRIRRVAWLCLRGEAGSAGCV